MGVGGFSSSFSHHGEFFSVPPTYTKWNHKQTIAYFQQDDAGRRLEDVLALGDPDMYSAGNPVQATTTTLRELQVFPQPLQKPHPQLWEPLTSARSLKFAAEHGINGVMIAEPNDRLRRNIEIYHEAAEKAGFPDMHNRGRFKFGWDAEKRRGIMTSRYLHITRPVRRRRRSSGQHGQSSCSSIIMAHSASAPLWHGSTSQCSTSTKK
jgi:hypothetical protein